MLLNSTNLMLQPLIARFNLAGEFVLESSSGQVLEIESTLKTLKEQSLLKSAIATVWVPTQLVVLAQVNVPGKRKSDWMAALPYALEESLSEPVESFHFVVLNRSAQGDVAAAVVERKWLKKWLKTLAELGLSDVQLVADCFSVPLAKSLNATHQAWSIFSGADSACVRTGLYSGFAGDASWLEQIRSLHQAVDNGVELLELSPTERLHSGLAVANQVKPYNLRTAEFRAQSHLALLWCQWRWVSLIGVLMVAATLVATYMETQRLQAQTQQYQQQTQALFKTMFPEVKRIVNIKAQTLSRLKGADQTADDRTAPTQLIRFIEPLFKQVPEVQIQKVQWSVSAKSAPLTLAVQAPQASQLQKIVTLAKAQKNQAKITLELKNVTPDLAEGVFNVDAN